MDLRPLLLMLVALLAKSQGEATCPIFTARPSLSTLRGVMKEVPGAECRRQVAVLLEGVRNLTDWALQMVDATAEVPSGLLRGNLRALGDMDECVAVEAVVQNDTLHGKYCLASLHADSEIATVARLLDIATSGRRHLEFRHRKAEMGEGWVMESPRLSPDMSRGEWGVCVPAACSAADVEAALRGLARRLLPSTGLSLDVRVPPLACRTRAGPARPLRAQHLAFATITGVLVILSVIGTLWDSCFEEDADASRKYRVVLRAFSLRVGWKRLTSERREELGCIAGIRALASISLTAIHEVLYFSQEPSINKVNLMEMTSKIYYTPFLAGAITVETFFTISGTLYSYYLANSIINGKFSYISTLFHRFVRLSPVYFLLILFYTTFLEYLGDGPNWSNFINYSVQSCRESWIWNVLYLNNYTNDMNVCMNPAWFLAADMQLMILAPLAVLPLFRWRRGRQLMLVFIALSMVVTAASIVILRVPSIYNFYDTDRQIILFLIKAHSRTHMHFSSYLVGLSLGYVLHKTKNKEIYLSKGILIVGWTFSVLIVLANCVGPNYMLQASYKYNLFDSAAYPAIGRLLWAIAVSWIIFTCHAGYGGLLNRLFNCHALLVISRLSYSINLAHFILLLHNGGRRRTPLWIDVFALIETILADLIISILISFVLFVLVDSPANLITRAFLLGGASKKNGSPPVTTENKEK